MIHPNTVLQSRYRILGLLGQGGMGAVYLAEDLSLGRRCAIKENVPDPNASPQVLTQMRQQFQAEARILANLDHPNLPKVHDYFSFNGNEYIVMDYVEGENLHSLQQRQGGPLPEQAVLVWADQVLDALTYLHGQQPHPIIHRDIKPANIILTPQGKVKLVDFGLVKLLDPNDPRTATAMKGMGTPEYAPLEQYAGGQGHTDARTDIYSLGGTLYHLLTGVPPADVHQRILDPTLLAPPRRLNPRLSPNTEAALLKALEIHPAQRFQHAVEMRQTLVGMPASPAAAPHLAPSRGGRRPAWLGWLVGVVAVACLALIALMALRDGTPSGEFEATQTAGAAVAALTLTPASEPTSIPVTDTPVPLTPAPTNTAAPATVTPVTDAGEGMVLVPAGDFTMGSLDGQGSDEHPQHTVYLDTFRIDKTEVTNAMFARFVEETGHQTEAEKAGSGWAFTGSTWEEVQGTDWRHSRGPGSNIDGLENHPVVQVSWSDAQAYCEWAGKRLPSEAEWEKAARGTDGRTYPWGDQTPAGDLLNFADRNLAVDWADKNVDDGYQYTAPAGSYPAGASPVGALDMAGNVWEWVADWYDGTYYASSPRENPQGPGTGSERVLRGGSWSDDPYYVRSALRVGDAPDSRDDYLGFRCARSP